MTPSVISKYVLMGAGKYNVHYQKVNLGGGPCVSLVQFGINLTSGFTADVFTLDAKESLY